MFRGGFLFLRLGFRLVVLFSVVVFGGGVGLCICGLIVGCGFGV